LAYSKDDASVNGQALGLTNRTAIIDTGTSKICQYLNLLIQALLIIPPDDAVTIHSAIPSSITDGQGDFAFPCSTSVQLAVSFGGKSFNISPKDYVGQPLDGGNNLCQSNIVGQQVGGPNQWLLGDVYLKNVYTVFDYDNNQVGFGAKTSNGSSSGDTGNQQQFMASSDARRSSGSATMTLIYGIGSVFLSMILFF
jgi:cathepsin D